MPDPEPCRLCGNRSHLRRSHIIPEFAYKVLYDENHRFTLLSTIEGRASRTEQKGFRERLLCAECEGRLSLWERYASSVFSGGQPLSILQTNNFVEVRGLNYKLFKLFAMSVLWRAGVSTMEYFARVDLGPHEQKLRSMLLAGDPGEPTAYAVFLCPLVRRSQELAGLHLAPTRSRLGKHRCYRFVFGGLIWMFLVSRAPLENEVQEALLNRDGQMVMMVQELTEADFVVRSLEALMQRGAFNKPSRQ